MNSQYLSELGYTYQALKNCDKSIATYSQAASMAELGSDDTTKTADLTAPGVERAIAWLSQQCRKCRPPSQTSGVTATLRNVPRLVFPGSRRRPIATG